MQRAFSHLYSTYSHLYPTFQRLYSHLYPTFQRREVRAAVRRGKAEQEGTEGNEKHTRKDIKHQAWSPAPNPGSPVQGPGCRWAYGRTRTSRGAGTQSQAERQCPHLKRTHPLEGTPRAAKPGRGNHQCAQCTHIIAPMTERGRRESSLSS